MLVAATICPHPPALVPAVESGAAGELDELRDVCLDSVRRLVNDVDHVIAIGGGSEPGEWDASVGGHLRAFGVDVEFGGDDRLLPLSLTIGSFLLDEIGWSRTRRSFVAVTDAMSAMQCAEAGATLLHNARDSRLGLLVMGDGSAKRTRTSPGYLDERAIGYDDVVVNALEKADVDALLALTPDLARELWVAGRPAWQVLAGAARSASEDGTTVTAQVSYDGAPYGVGYVVADWAFSGR
jgi:hypothetical protein